MVRCINCILPENYPGVDFDEKGCCFYCRDHKTPEFIQGNNEDELMRVVDEYRGKGQKYDCIVAFSGGRDSSYTLWYTVKKLKLKVLACLMDNGMVPDHTLQNVKNAVKILNADLHIKKYDYLVKNLRHIIKSWMAKPTVGMISIICTGCAYGRRAGLPIVAKKFKVPMMVVGGGEPQLSFAERYLSLGKNPGRFSLIAGFALEVFKNPRYIIKPSCLNVMSLEFAYRFLERYIIRFKNNQYPRIKVFPHKYIGWNEQEMLNVITSQLDWQKSEYSEGSWRSDCKLALFKNYLYDKTVGFNKHDDLFSGMIRNGLISREDALLRLKKEKDVKEEFVVNLFDELELDYNKLKTALKNFNSSAYASTSVH